MKTPKYIPLCGALVASLLCGLSTARAQLRSDGIRVNYAKLGSQGSMVGHAFVPVSSRHVTAEPTRRCRGYVTLHAEAVAARGPLRRIELTVQLPISQHRARVALGRHGCSSADIRTTILNDAAMRGGAGQVVLSRVRASGRYYVEGSFSQVAHVDGAPVTLKGSFRLPWPGAPVPASATRVRQTRRAVPGVHSPSLAAVRSRSLSGSRCTLWANREAQYRRGAWGGLGVSRWIPGRSRSRGLRRL